MKTKINILKITLAFFLVFFIIFSSCKKPEPSPVPATQYGTLLLHLHTNIDTSEVDSLGIPYMNLVTSPNDVAVNFAQLYLSNIRAVKADGSIYPFPGVVVLKTIDIEPYTIGQVPAGNYKSVMFDVGVDSPLNHINPSTYPFSSPLSTQTPSMWFGDTGEGYITFNFNGNLVNGTKVTPFNYQIGGDGKTKTVTLPDEAFTISPNTPHEVHITIDYGKIFTGLNLATENICNTYGDPLAAKIANNFPAMFRYEQ